MPADLCDGPGMKTKLFFITLACGLAMTAAAKDSLELKADSDQRSLLRSRPGELVVRIDLTAPAGVKTSRSALNLAVVLDRSGSMAGAKIEKARQAAMGVVEQLGGKDLFALVAYETRAQVLVPSGPVEDKGWLRSRIAQIESGGSTALYHGVEKGAAEVERHLSPKKINRVILLSDGLANVGPSSPADLRELGRHLTRRGIAVSTVGVGDDYNEDLMAGLAESSDANYYYVKDIEQLPSIFAKELGQLLTVVARNVRIEVTCPPGIEPLGFIGRPEIFRDRKAVVEFSPVCSGQNRFLFLRCRVEGEEKRTVRDVAMIRAFYTEEPDGTRERSLSRAVQVALTDDRKEALASINPAIAAQRELMFNATVKDEAIVHADARDYRRAATTLDQQAERLSGYAADAPAEIRNQIDEEVRSLRSRARDLRENGMSQGLRKGMQCESWSQRNAK